MLKKLLVCYTKQRYKIVRNLVEVLIYHFTEKILIKIREEERYVEKKISNGKKKILIIDKNYLLKILDALYFKT